MPVYTITFELNSKGGTQDYKQLVEDLREQKCVPVLRNHWLGSFNNSAAQVQNHFKALIGKTDRIMVAELYRHYAFANCLPHCSKWLELNPASDPMAIGAGSVAAAKPAVKAGVKPAAKAAARPKPAARPAATTKPAAKPEAKTMAKPAASKPAPAKKAPVARAAKPAARTGKQAKA